MEKTTQLIKVQGTRERETENNQRKRGRPSTIQLNENGRYIKRCSCCQRYYPLDEFYFNNKTGYFGSYCRRHAGFNSKMFLLSMGVFERRAYQVVARSKNKGIPHTSVRHLTRFLESCWRTQHGRCYLTGLPLKVEANWKDDPLYAWQVDRINPNRGYVKGNLGISSAAINFVKQHMQLPVFITLCQHITSLHGNSSRATESK
jgi:hypothetical protein